MVGLGNKDVSFWDYVNSFDVDFGETWVEEKRRNQLEKMLSGEFKWIKKGRAKGGIL